MKSITLEDLSKYLTNDAILVDVRNSYEYSLGHLNGAVNMPHVNALSLLMKYPKDKVIILYCRYGMTSSRIGRMLSSLGYTNIYSIEGLKDKLK